MADRGIEYGLKVGDEFSKTLSNFTKQVKTAEKNFRSLQNLASKGIVVGSRKDVSKDINKTIADASKKTNDLVKAKSKLTQAETSLTKATAGRAKVSSSATVGESNAVQKLVARLKETEHHANRVSFTFRRLFGILAAFTAARLGTAGFIELIKQSIKFNENLEQSILGVSALIAGLGDVKDASGQTVTASEELARSQGEARKQIELLRRDALRTAATFDQIVETFQTGIAPGFQAGLNLEEIRKFTIQISQAASIIGVSQSQLGEEIRSLLQGTINTRTTRIATALGITNEDIRRVKEAGKLFEFLQERFEAIDKSGESFLTTLTALRVNVLDSINLLIGTAVQPTFTKLKDLLESTFETLTDVDPITDTIIPSPEGVKAVQAVAKGIESMVDRITELQRNTSSLDIVTIFQTLGKTIEEVSKIFFVSLDGFLLGLTDVKLLLLTTRNLFRELGTDNVFKKLGVTVDQVISRFVQLLTLLVGINVVLQLVKFAFAPLKVIAVAFLAILSSIHTVVKLIVSPVKSIGILWKSLNTTSKASLISFGKLSVVITGIAALTGIILKSVQKIFSKESGIDLTLLQSALIVLASTEYTLKRIYLRLQQVKEFAFGPSLPRLRQLLSGKELTPRFDFKKSLDALEKDFETRLEEILLKKPEEIFEDFKILFDKFIDNITPNIDVDLTLPKVLEIKTIQEEFERLGAIYSNNTLLLNKQAQTLEKIEEASKQVTRSFTAGIANIGISSSLQDINQEIYGFEQDRLEAVEELTSAIKQSQLTIEKATNRKKQIDEEVLDILGEQLTLSNELESNSLIDKYRDSFKELHNATRDAKLEILESIQEEIALREKIDILTSDIARKEKDLSVARLGGKQDEVAIFEVELQILNDELKTTKKLAKETQALNATKLPDKELQIRNRLIELLTEESKLLSTVASTEEDIANTRASILEIENKLFQNAIKRLTLKSREDIEQRQINTANLATELKILELKRRQKDTFSVAESRVLAAQQEVVLLQNSFDLNEKVRVANENNLKNQIKKQNSSIQELEVLKSKTTNKELQLQLETKINNAIATRTILQERLNELTNESNLARQTELFKLREAEIELEEERAKALSFGEAVSLGFRDSLQQLALETPDVYEATISTLKGIVTGFSDFVARSITSAFDPNSDASLKERFGLFLKGIADEVIAMLVRIAVMKAVLGLVNIFGGGGLQNFGGLAGTKGAGFAGLVGPNKGGKIQGFAEGGPTLPRPAGISPKDTVPAWLTPNEWVIRAEAVRKYGDQVLDKINRGLIDPTSLRAISTGIASRPIRKAKKIGYASGGVVTGPREINASPQPKEQQVSIAVVAPTEQSMSRLLSGGKSSMLSFVSENKSQFKSILGIS